ncbi:MAG: exodeoxyribonuclease V subunit alpha, partial [Prochlorococcaceae cyanobacterium]
MSPGPALAEALVEALPRLCTPHTALDPLLAELIRALADVLEAGALELDLSAPPPDGLDARHWPEAYRQALDTSALAVAADALESAPEAPLVLAGERLRWRRWHLQL